MVVIHVKKAESTATATEAEAEAEAEEHQFLYECPSSSSIDEVADAIIVISNLQSRIQTLSLQLRHRLLTDALKESFPDAALALDRALSEAETYASRSQVLYKRALSPRALRDHLHAIEQEARVTHSKCFGDSSVLQLSSDGELHEDTQLWWAGKELTRGKRLCDYIGGNEKTKIIIGLKPGCSGSQQHTVHAFTLSTGEYSEIYKSQLGFG